MLENIITNEAGLWAMFLGIGIVLGVIGLLMVKSGEQDEL